MASQHQGVNMDKFDAYFQQADLNKDGKISGAEAVTFFERSNLPKNVLAQIWQYADQSHTGFLGRAEFYNSLKLVTVAQSKRELTPDIVKAALYGPATAKIPAPQINVAGAPPTLFSSAVSAPSTEARFAALPPFQNIAIRGQAVPNMVMSQRYPSSQQSHVARPPQSMAAGTASSPQGLSGLESAQGTGSLGHATPNLHISHGLSVDRTIYATSGVGSPNIGVSPSSPRALTTLQNTLHKPYGNGFASDSVLGGDMFSSNLSIASTHRSAPTYSTNSRTASIAAHNVSSGPQPPMKSESLDSSQSSFMIQPSGNQLQRVQSSLNQNQQVLAKSLFASSGISVGSVNSTSNQSHASWPRMTPSDIQKYTKVFLEVDSDRDGMITGEQARNLFLSWRLPRDILKQVWDLSDQDNDSMLSLKEFCFALYLMERYRGGHSLPTVLPNSLLYDETLMLNTSQTGGSHRNVVWGSTPGLRPQQGITQLQQMTPTTGLRPSMPVSLSQTDGPLHLHQQNSRVPLIKKSVMNHARSGQQNLISEASLDTENKGEGTMNKILDSREKIEFFRTKMQDLVLYKSRCDNLLNEITERASADKCEAELLGKKYEERYKQVGEVASKLAIEEAKFHDIQGRKTELNQAIIKMEQGGSVDGILQVRVDRIQSDLEELMNALSERGKKYGFDVKSTTLANLPIGWQHDTQEGTVDWDEDWDKFEDEGFSCTNDPNGEDGLKLPPKPMFEGDAISDKGLDTFDASESQREDEMSRSPHIEAPSPRNVSQGFSDINSVKSSEADEEMHRFDEPRWGVFDNNEDDTDSVWGFDTKNVEKQVENREKSPFSFADSLPGTPSSRFGNSPRYSEASGDQFFDNLSRFDSFSMHDTGCSHTFTRFDSISSSKDFSSSEYADPFGSIAPFKVSGESDTPRKGSENWSSF